MNIDNLHVGMVAKNYKDLCRVLEVEPKKNNSKIAQLKDIECLIKYSKQGHSFIVEEIYDSRKEKEDGRSLGGNSSSYSKDAELLLIDLLLCGDGELILPNTALLKALQFVNHNYHYYYGDNRPILANDLNIDLNLINDYYRNVNSSLVGNLKTIISRLEKKKLVFHKEPIMVKVVEISSSIYNEHGRFKLDISSNFNESGIEETTYKPVTVRTKEVYREATVEEIRKILRIQRETMIELGFNRDDKYNVLYRSGLTFKFNKIVNNRLLKELNILRSYKSHHLIFNNDHLEDERLYLLDEIEKDLIKTNINGEVRKRIMKNARNRAKNASTALLNELYKNNKELDGFKNKSKDLYTEHYEILNTFLIDNKLSKDKEDEIVFNSRISEPEIINIELPELM